jgi:hypothetical protein
VELGSYYLSNILQYNLIFLLLEHTYKRALSKYYGQKPGRNLPLSDYGDFRSQVNNSNEKSFIKINIIILVSYV